MAQNETIGQRIAKYRRIEGWSAQKLAEESGLSRSVITNIENGRKEDVTVRELLAMSEALRVPPAALMYPIDRPLQPATPNEEDEPGFAPRVIDLVEWIVASDIAAEVDPQVAEFNKKLEEMDGVVVYPVGLTVLATYGKAGRHARSLLNGARALERAVARFEVTRKRLLLFVRDAWSYRYDREQSDRADNSLDSGDFSSSTIGSELLSSLDASDREAVQRLMREHDASVRNLRDAQAQFRLLGGDPEFDSFGMSARAVMGIVESMPHERVGTTRQRGHMAEGIVESPLRKFRFDEYNELRRQLNLAPIDEEDGDGERQEEA
ncbi:helix-turn-helix domain-containing protein [Leifsonia sp. NPDC058292]|uniref:helix-turn-helix domain-containing protein n=1 Tax=Leifsonia sp. NPDC058292 TaxID=3346428 RepID=UPI0036D816B8